MTKRKAGRKKGGHNRGYFFRKGRGWYVVDGQRLAPLRDELGGHVKEERAPKDLLRDAYARWRTGREEEIAEQRRRAKSACSRRSVYDVCKAHLYDVQVNGARKTLADRMDTLFDFCWGLPPEYREPETFDPKKLTGAQKREAEAKRFHEGYGRLAARRLVRRPCWTAGPWSRTLATGRHEGAHKKSRQPHTSGSRGPGAGKAGPQLRAMILLGVNCGFGNADCGTLPIEALDLDGGWIDFARPKTGVNRRCPLC